MAELITMTQKELSRYEIIKRLVRKENEVDELKFIFTLASFA